MNIADLARSSMIVLAAAALNIFYPGEFFRAQEGAFVEIKREKSKRMDFVNKCGDCGTYILSEV